jgi:hypothetical protein
MINNESLFDNFRTARYYGYRSGWDRKPLKAPTPQRVSAYYGIGHGMPEPAETISETDVFEIHGYAECGQCGETDYAAMLSDGICQRCVNANYDDWQETLASIRREEYAMRGGPLVY